MDKHSTVGAIYTDFSKAFDKVNHEVLLHKLSLYGIADPLLGWCRSYLSERRSSVVVNGEASEAFEPCSGVPQGSHLGPLFFNVFINDISQCFLNTDFLLFADDLKFFRVLNSNDDINKLQKDLDSLSSWCDANSMYLNTSKCFAIQFTRKKKVQLSKFFINGVALSNVSEIRDLGVLLDSKLRFHTHIDHIATKGFKSLGFVLRSCKDFRSPSTKILLYNAIVRSGLEYCSVVWNPFDDVYCKRLERIQKRFLWHLTFSRNLGRELLKYETRLQHFNMLSLQQRRSFLDNVFLFKILHSCMDAPKLLSVLSLSAPMKLPRASRFNAFCVPAANTNLGQSAPMTRLVRQHNIIAKTKDIDIFFHNVTSFRSALKNTFKNTLTS